MSVPSPSAERRLVECFHIQFFHLKGPNLVFYNRTMEVWLAVRAESLVLSPVSWTRYFIYKSIGKIQLKVKPRTSQHYRCEYFNTVCEPCLSGASGRSHP